MRTLAVPSRRALLPLALLLLVAVMATAVTAAFDFGTVPPAMWTNSRYTVSASSSEAAPAGNGDRLLLDCGAAATVTPVAGFSLSQATAFDFVITTAAAATSGDCVFTRTGDFHGPETQTTAVTVAAQRTLTVSPASSADSPIVVGTISTATLTFTPSTDLANQLQVHMQCTGLVATTIEQFGVQLQSGPGSANIRMSGSAGLVECRYMVTKQEGSEELAAPQPTFFRVVPTVRLVPAIGGAAVPDTGLWSDSLAAVTPYAVSVAPPFPMNFVLTLNCDHPDMAASTVTFTDATAAAQSLSFTTPAAPAAGSALSVSCGWSGSGAAFTKRFISLPSELNFFIGNDVAVTSSAAPLQLNAESSWQSTVTLTAPAGTAFAEEGIQFTAKCSAGTLSTSTFALSGGALTATATFTAAPVVGSASAPKCAFTTEQAGDFRRVKVPVADVTFDVAAATPKLQLVAKGLPTAADVLVAEPAGVTDWTTAAAGVPFVLSPPVGMPADISVNIGLSCSAPKYGATVAVTPAIATLSGAAPSPAAFSVAVTRADPAVADALSDLVSCTWSVMEGDASKYTLPTDFSFVVGTAVQLEVRQYLDETAPFTGVVQGQRVAFYLQSAGEQAALVGADFRFSVSCGSCESGEQTGVVFVADPAWDVYPNAFPRGVENTRDITAVSPGVVTCRWSFPAGYPWSRAFIAPQPTVITILPLVEVEVRGVPTVADLLPRSAQEAPFYLTQSVAPGQVFTITMAAAPAEVVFHGSATNTFTLRCDGGAVVSGDFIYSESSRGPLTQTLTMPLLTDSQPVEVWCYLSADWYSRGPLTVFAEGTQPNFGLLVVDTPTVLTPRLTQTGPLFTGGESHVSLNPSRTVQATGELYVDVACAMSAPADGLTVSGFGKGVVEQAGQMQGSVFTFRLTHGDYLLTAEATNPALVFGYKLGLPSSPTTLTCTHTLLPTVNSVDIYYGRADRMLSLLSDPIVITVLPTHSVAVTGVPTGPLGNAPAEQTISVLPTLRPNAVFTDQQTLLVTLSCPGLTLPSNGLLTFTGTGIAALNAQPITFTPPTVTAGAGNVWLCSWQLGGSDGQAFQLPAAFQIVVGVVDSWTVEVVDQSVSLFVGGTKQGQLRAPGSMPSAGTVTAACGPGQWLNFARTEGPATTFSASDATLDFTFGGNIAGALNCRFRVSDMPAGFPLLASAPLAFTVRPQATFTVDGLTSPGLVQITGGVGASLSIAPTEAPGAWGVTVTLSCQSSSWGGVTLSMSVDRLFFPTGSTAAQSIELGRLNERSAFKTQCHLQMQDGGQFAQPAPFVVEVTTTKDVVVSGLDSQGRLIVASECEVATFTVSPSAAPTVEQGSLEFEVSCDGIDSENISPKVFTFTAAAWQPVTVTVRAPGAPISARCWAWNNENDYTEVMFYLVFGSPPVLAVEAPSFVPLGATAPITLRLPAGRMFLPSSQTKLHARCSHQQLRSEVISMSWDGEMYVSGMTAVELQFFAAGQRVIESNTFSNSRSPVTMALPRGKRAKTAAANRPLRTNKKEQHQRRQRQAAKPLAMSSAAAVAVGLGAVANELVTCTWELYGNDEARFSLQPTSTFLVGSAVEMTGQLADGAASVMQGRTVSLIVAPTTATPVDVIVDVVCSAGVSASAPTVTLVADATGSQSVTLTVAADAAPGAASCTLTPSGAGRLAVSNSPIVAFAIEPAPVVPSSTGSDSTDSDSSSAGSDSAGTGASSSSSSTGGSDGASASSSSTGTKPCGGDYECGAFAAASLPGLAAVAAMLLAAAFAQQQ